MSTNYRLMLTNYWLKMIMTEGFLLFTRAVTESDISKVSGFTFLNCSPWRIFF